MYNYIKILIFALVVACSGIEVKPDKCVYPVTISDALPIQFWDISCDTYNEDESCGVHHRCFCHPWQCDDEIVLQVSDENWGKDYFLIILDEEDSELLSVDFTKQVIYDETVSPSVESKGVYSLSIVPESLTPEICDEQIRMLLRDKQPNWDFLTDLNTWVQYGGGTSWSWNTGAAQITGTNPVTFKNLGQDYNFQQGRSYKVFWEVVFSGTIFQADLNLLIYDSGGSLLQNIALEDNVAAGTHSGELILSDAQVLSAANFRLQVSNSSISGSFTARLNYLTVSDVIAKSDCIDIRTSQECSVLLEYSNSIDFAGLAYTDVSPESSFKLRIPAIFIHERFPETDDAIELTTGSVSTDSSLKVQRLLETNYLPYYMHKKIQLVLKHQSLVINNTEWLKEEPYEPVDGDRRSIVRKAKVFLTDKDYIARNVL